SQSLRQTGRQRAARMQACEGDAAEEGAGEARGMASPPKRAADNTCEDEPRRRGQRRKQQAAADAGEERGGGGGAEGGGSRGHAAGWNAARESGDQGVLKDRKSTV